MEHQDKVSLFRTVPLKVGRLGSMGLLWSIPIENHILYNVITFTLSLLPSVHLYCIERSVNISITRITRDNNICFCYVAISDDIPTNADFEVDGYHGC